MSNVEVLKNKVKELGIKARYTTHEPLFNVEDYIRIMKIGFDQGVSTLIFKSEKGYFGVYRRDDRKVNTGKLKKLLGVKSLNLANADEVKKEFDFILGSVGVYHPKLKYYIDKALFEKEEIYGGTGISTEDIVVSPIDLQKLSNAQVGDYTEPSEIRLTKKRILTGDRPTGQLHIGHMFGSLLNRVKLQNEYDEYIIIANIQALTDNFNNPTKIRENIEELLCDYYAVGIDVNISTIFIQSEVPEIHEIFIYLSNFATTQQINHNPTIKTELKQLKLEVSTPLGFYMYPIHQAADILCVNADLVPVGKDQAPMVEDTRELAKKFDAMYKTKIYKLPQALFGVEKNVPGIDGNAKMGKSLGNGIYLADSAEELKLKVNKIYTDPSRIHATDPGNIEGNVAFIYHDLFNDNLDEVEDLKTRYQIGKVGDVEVKQKLYIAMEKKLQPIREKRKEAEIKKKELLQVALEGSKKVRVIAREIADQMKEAMKIKF